MDRLKKIITVLVTALLLATPAFAAKTDEVLRAALQDLEQKSTMTPEAARQIQIELDLYLRDALATLGPLKSVYGMGSFETQPPFVYAGQKQKLQQFQATYEHGWIQWRVFVQPDGKIGKLVPFSINAPGTN